MSKERFRGIRIFDITDIAKPKYIANVQTCRGSHTHTVRRGSERQGQRLHLRLGLGAACVRRRSCRAARTRAGRRSELGAASASKSSGFRSRIRSRRRIVSSPRIFHDLHGAAQPVTTSPRRRRSAAAIGGRRSSRARGGAGGGAARGRGGARWPRRGSRSGPTQCHDITRLSGDRSRRRRVRRLRPAARHHATPANPKRIGAVADSNFSFWHSATFSNDGTKVLFSDEWGGGSRAALPRDRQVRVGRRRDLHAREQRR